MPMGGKSGKKWCPKSAAWGEVFGGKKQGGSEEGGRTGGGLWGPSFENERKRKGQKKKGKRAGWPWLGRTQGEGKKLKGSEQIKGRGRRGGWSMEFCR